MGAYKRAYARIRRLSAQMFTLGGNSTMVAVATIVSMPAATKAQQNVFALYHSNNPHRPPDGAVNTDHTKVSDYKNHENNCL